MVENSLVGFLFWEKILYEANLGFSFANLSKRLLKVFMDPLDISQLKMACDSSFLRDGTSFKACLIRGGRALPEMGVLFDER